MRAGLWFLIIAPLFSVSAAAQDHVVIPDRKLVEYGWDVPTSDFVAAHIAEMEGRPFDGLLFRLQGGWNVLEPAAWPEDKFKADFEILPAIQWNTFTDNFVMMLAASDQDWFNDAHWDAITSNVRLVSRAARLAKCVGLCFDAEPYGTNPWDYSKTAHASEKSYAEYSAMARKRGGQFMKAIESEFPNPRILNFYLTNLFAQFLDPMPDEVRKERLSKHDYALFPPFLEGMLENAGPNTEIYDGNESAYYYTEKTPYFESYQSVKGRGPRLYDPTLEPLYRKHVRMGQALYVDQYYGLRQNTPTLGNFMPPEDQAKWFEHNVYWALHTSDRYVWCYSERMDWWKNENIQPGSLEAIRSARGKIARGEPLGFDLAPIIDAAKKKKAETK
ncbi:MAG: hypothetical protein RBU21_21270 [FCB group bacterium]|jgi:hypothetical protein|nr:hypothetical protein [FCB group bacterium]